ENQKSALQVAKLLIDKQLPLPSDADISVIQKHITSATSDALIADKTKSAMTDLLANVREMKRIADQPEQRSLQSLIDKLIDLTDRQTELSEKMRIALNISEP
ncbi:MAG: hypothetical protein KDA65_20005, partial [Planctomycetaceae bacterium]|nr:hypothetical protein [Planctomycetaceae bacterium]